MEDYLGKLLVKLGVDDSELQAIPKKLNATAQKLRSFGWLASTALTMPIVALGKATFTAAKNYEFAIKKVEGLTGSLAKDVKVWEEQIMNMAPKVGKGPQELADALYFISSRAYTGAKGLDVLMKSAQGAAAGLGKTSDVANLVISALNAYAGTGLTATKVLDITVAAVKEGRAEAAGFASNLGQIIPIASELGVGLGDLAGGMAAITLTGSTTSQAATYLKGIFNSLAKETVRGDKALEEMDDSLTGMGSSYKELRDILANQGLIALLTKVRNLTGGDVSKISKIFPNIRGLSAALSIAGKNWEFNKVGILAVNNAVGTLDTAVNTVAETIQQRYNKAMAQMQVSSIVFGRSLATVFLPILSKVMDKVTTFTQRFDKLSEAQKNFAIKALMVTAALGPMSLAIATLGYSINGVITIFKGLSKIAAVFELGWVAAAVAGLAALGFVIYQVTKKKKELSDIDKYNKKTSEEHSRALADQSAELKVLTTALKDQNTPATVRAELLKKYNDNYQSLLGYMTTEKTSVDDLAKAYDKLNPKIQAKIDLDASQNYGAGLKVMVEASKQRLKNAEMEMVKWNFEIEKLKTEYQAIGTTPRRQGDIISESMMIETQNRNPAIKELNAAKIELAKEEAALATWNKMHPESTTAGTAAGPISPIPINTLKSYATGIGYLKELKIELKKLKADRLNAATEDDAKGFDSKIAEVEAKIAEVEAKWISSTLAMQNASRTQEEATVKGMMMSSEREALSLFNIKIKYLNLEIEARKKVGENTKQQEADLQLALAEQNSVTRDRLMKSGLDEIKIRQANQEAALDLIVGHEREVANKREAIQIQAVQDELDLRKFLLNENVAVEQNELNIRKKKNQEAFQEEFFEKKRILAEYLATYSGMISEIDKKEHEGEITKQQAEKERREAHIATYDFMKNKAKENALFMQSLTKRELQDYIDFLLTKVELAKTAEEKIAAEDEVKSAQALLRTKSKADRMKSIGETLQQSLNSFAGDLATTIGDSLGALIANTGGLEDAFRNILSVVASFLKQLGSALITAAIASRAFQESLMIAPEVALFAGLAAVTAGAALTGLLEKGVFGGKERAMKDGGLLSGPTHVLAGEYQGARDNPEVFAPLNSLKSMLRPAYGKERLVADISARKLQIILKREDSYQNNRVG